MLVPGMVLYHRGNYIHDKYHSFGEVALVEIKNGLLIFETKEGTKRFTWDDIGRYLFFDEASSSEVEIINGPTPILDTEKNRYVREEKDQVFLDEKRTFDQLVGKFKKMLSLVSDKIITNKYGYIHVQEVHVASQRSELQKLREQEERYKAIIAEPYFAKLELGKYKFPQVYIGNLAVHESSESILDWREPIAQLYYTKNPVEYKKYDLKLIRKFDVYGGSFCGYYDSYRKENDSENAGIIDDFFLSVIKQKREIQGLQDIIQTIQDKQFEIISLPSELNIRVQGCAGSGKTMILMHRISHMLYNNKEINYSNIVVITPNKHLNLELSEVARKLDLDQIKRATLQEYYLDLIEKYMNNHAISTSSKYFSKLKAFSDELSSPITPDSAISDVQRTDFEYKFKLYMDSFQEFESIFPYANLFAIEDLKHSHHGEFIEDFAKKTGRLTTIMEQANRQGLIDEKTDIEKLKSQTKNKMNNAYRKFHSLLQKYGIIETVKSLSISEVMNFQLTSEQSREISDKMENEIKNQRNIFTEQYKKNERIEQLELQITSYLKKYIFTRYKELFIHNLMLSLDSLTSNKLFRYLYYFSLEYKKVDFLKKYKFGKNNSYLLEAWNAFIKDWKRGASLDLEYIYSFEYYELLKMLHYSYGRLSSMKEWLFVDEGQDYASPLIEVLTDVYPNAIINIFGDSNQRLAIDHNSYFFDKCKSDAEFSSYEIKTNYRNCVEITSHINEQCDMDIIPIGLHGSVTINDQVLDKEILWDKYTGRRIIIVQNESSFNTLVSKLPLYILNNVRYNDFTFSDKHTNVMSVKAVKGLEFEEVMVYNDEMDQNEYYVACSRALNHLTILA